MQIRNALAGACCLGLLAAAGIAQAASLSKTDKQFLATAARTNMTVAHEGQMAGAQAASPDVKSFAEKLVQDQNDSYARIDELASKSGDAIPKGIDAAKIPAIARLSHLKGAGFDKQFTRDEAAAEQQAIAAFKREARHGQDAGVKDYAKNQLPTLQKDLQQAQSCLKPAKHG
ncbi:MAG TPA: DUF4142 domain-containing protein [Bryobacteraceae bacterium]|nr:DUF4142 domain-containing protein [Bryobacteraceae bacterium]